MKPLFYKSVFLFFCVASSSYAAEQAELTYLEGDVQVLLQGQDELAAAQEGMLLEPGDKVKTLSNGSCELSFNEDNTNVVRLSKDTEVKALLSGDEKIDIVLGEVFSSIASLPAGSAFEIRTPTAVSGARGTDWVTKVGDDGTDVEAIDSTPYVKHFESSGQLSPQPTFIEPGQMTTVRKFQPPTPLRPVPPGRRQSWQGVKQNLELHGREAIMKRPQRPPFNRDQFLQGVKGKRTQGAMNRGQGPQTSNLIGGAENNRPGEKKGFIPMDDSRRNVPGVAPDKKVPSQQEAGNQQALQGGTERRPENQIVNKAPAGNAPGKSAPAPKGAPQGANRRR